MNRSPEIGKLAAALAKAQKAIKGAVKDAKNPHFNSRYADLESIHDACQEPLADNEIAVVQSPTTPEAGLFGMTTILLHSSGEWIESDLLTVQAKDAGPQAAGSCTTYLRRYQLAAMAGVAPKDDDAEAAEGRATSSQHAARPQPPARPPLPNANRMPAPKPTPTVTHNPKPNTSSTGPINADDIPF